MNDYEIWYAISNLSYKTKNNLLSNLKNVQEIWYYVMNDIKNDFITAEERNKLKNAWNKEKLSFIKNKLINEDIKTVVITDEFYPKRLKYFDDSPYMLFYKGDIESINAKHCISIVGSRNCTNYGVNITNIIVDAMSQNNINIISGMARGIDSAAHKRCIKNNLYTCAVMGSGIDVIYPKENRTLFNDIIDNGCVISQFIPGTKPYSFNFPIRNKIISALSDLVVVVEAGEKSGSLITASAALEQGKDVVAVPGDIFSNQSKGTNKLIRDGAYVFTSLDDLYEILKINPVLLKRKDKVEMNSKEKLVYDNIKTSPIHFDEILRITKIDIKQLYEVLFELQLKDEIISLSGNYYVRNNKEI